jgi:hypothetical protein
MAGCTWVARATGVLPLIAPAEFCERRIDTVRLRSNCVETSSGLLSPLAGAGAPRPTLLFDTEPRTARTRSGVTRRPHALSSGAIPSESKATVTLLPGESRFDVLFPRAAERSRRNNSHVRLPTTGHLLSFDKHDGEPGVSARGRAQQQLRDAATMVVQVRSTWEHLAAMAARAGARRPRWGRQGPQPGPHCP